jgi:hypothetical protein
MTSWDRALAAHDRAVENCIAAARAVPAERWNARGEGWSPSQELRHVALAYSMVRENLAGRAPRVRVFGPMQWVLRNVWLPILLRTGRFGRVAAPRETRPPDGEMSFDDAAKLLRDEASSCRAAMIEAKRERPRFRLTHPYFGPISLFSMLRLGNVHTAHHARKLAR